MIRPLFATIMKIHGLFSPFFRERGFLSLLSAMLALPACTGSEARQTADPVVVAYVTSWSDVMPDPARVTHVNYAFGHVSDSFDGLRIDNEARLRSIVALKDASPDIKVLLSVGGWGSGRFSEMAASDKYRAAFAAECARVVDEIGLDGIDIDWEYPTSSAADISSSPEDTDNFTLLMKEIRSAIGPGKLLTAATVCSAQYIDFPSILPFVDFINIMSYDMGWAPFHNAPLRHADPEGNISPIVAGWTVDKAVSAHLEAGIPKEKLVMGMPLYGRAAPNSPYSGFSDYRDIRGPVEGHTEIWDEIARVPYYADETGRLVLGFDNIRSISEKCDYILENGLRGGMYWDYAGDNDAGDLTRTIASKILGR